LIANWKPKDSRQNCSRHSPEFLSYFNFFMGTIFMH